VSWDIDGRDAGSVIEVAIGPGNAAGQFEVEVVRSPAGEASARTSLDAGGLLARLPDFQRAVLASAVSTRQIPTLEEKVIRETGQALYTALLGQEPVATRYSASAALAAQRSSELRIVLRVDSPELAALPWEAMYDQVAGGYVCRRHQLVRHVPVAAVPLPLKVSLPLRVLGVISAPRGLPLLDAHHERDHLDQALAGLIDEGLAEVIWAPSATWSALHATLMKGPWHVVHFIGHGSFDPDRDEGLLFLEHKDGRPHSVPATQFADLLRQAHPMPRLVLLNACSTATAGFRDLFAGTASTLARSDVSAVAAMQLPISDKAAVAFAEGFYAALAHGRGVDEATSAGRIAILGTGDRTLEWVTPVLYLRSRGDLHGQDAHLFDLRSDSTETGTRPYDPIVFAEAEGNSVHVDGTRKETGRANRRLAALSWNPTVRRRVLAGVGIAGLIAVVLAILLVMLPGHTSPPKAQPTRSAGPTPTPTPTTQIDCAPGSGSITLIGSAFGPIAQEAGAAYMQHCKGDIIRVESGNNIDSADGVSQVQKAVQGHSPQAGSMIAMYDGITNSAQGLQSVPVGVMIYSVVAHTGAVSGSNISVANLKQLYIEPGGLSGKIGVGFQAGSGTRQALFGIWDEPASALKTPGPCPAPSGQAVVFTATCTVTSNAAMLEFVNETPNAIGYLAVGAEVNGYPTGYPYAQTIDTDTSVISIDGAAPTPANVHDGSYPFVAAEHLYLSPHPSALASSFLAYLPQFLSSYQSPDFTRCSNAPPRLTSECAAAP